MKNKSSHHKDTNTFKFQPFSERISNIDIDIFHRVPHEYESTDEEIECNFHQCLLKWDLLCLTQNYQKFRQHMNGIITLPQLLHRKQQVIDELITYLKQQDILCMQPLLELLVALVKDLQKDFYPYYPQFLTVLIELLKTKETDQIEWTFTSLAFVFKLTWRTLIKDIQNVFKSLLPLLSDNRPEYIINFASESFAFVARKIKDRRMFLKLMLKSVAETEDGVVGCGRLLFEVMNGVDGNFHSYSLTILPFLFDSLADTTYPQQLLFEIIKEVVKNICNDIKPTNNAIFWQSSLDTVAKHAQTNLSCLNFDLQLIAIAVDHKFGKFLTTQKEHLIQTLKTILIHELPKEALLTVSKLSVSLLTYTQYIHLSQEESILISSQILRVNNADVLLDFVTNVISYASFDIHILPHFLKECFKNSFDDKFLMVLAKICQNRAPFVLNGVNLHEWRVCNLPFSSNTDRISFQNVLMNHIQSINIDINTFDQEVHMQSLICAPHVFTSKFLSMLNDNIKLLCDSVNNSADDKLESHLLLLLFTVECLIHVDVDGKSLESNFEVILTSCLKLCTQKRFINALKTLDMCFTKLCNCNSDVKSLDTLLRICAVLTENFSSPYHDIRLLTIHIYTLFEDLTDLKDFNIFSICFAIESTTVSVETFRDQLQNLQKLEYTHSHIMALNNTEFETVPLKYLIGVLYINFKPLWEPVIKIIETYAHAMPASKFWPIFYSELKNATLNKSRNKQIAELLANVEVNFLDEIISSHDDKPDFGNFRFYLWKAMTLFPDLAESKTRDVAELFLQFFQNEFLSASSEGAPISNIKICAVKCNEGDEMELEEDGSVGKAKKKKFTPRRKPGDRNDSIATLIQCLNVFSKVRSPLSMYKEKELYKIYQDLLSHKNAQIQKFALDCLLPYKHKYLTPYQEHLYNLIDDKNFKKQLSMFRVDAESNVIQPEHRDDLMPIIMQIVYAKMTAKTGMRTAGKTGGQFRRNLVFRFLAGCPEKEMTYFLKMSFRFYDTYLNIDENLCEEIYKIIDLERFPSLKRLQSSLNLLSVVFQQFGGLMADSMMKILLKIIFIIGAHITGALKRNSEIYTGFLGNLRTLRAGCVKSLEKFYNRFEKYKWSAEETSTLFDIFIWPNLGKLCTENVSSPSTLLHLLHQWGQNPLYFHLLDRENNGETAIKHLMVLLNTAKVHRSVTILIIDIVEKLISLQPEEKQLEASHLNYGTKILIPHVTSILEYFKRKLAWKKSLTQREMFILSRISELVSDPDLSDLILNLLLPILMKKFASNTGTENAVTTVVNLMQNVTNPDKHLRLLSPLFGVVTSIPSRKILCSALMKISNFQAYADIVNKLNAWDAKWVEQPDFQQRLDGFKLVADLTEDINVDFGILIIHNCWHFLQNEKDLAMRENASHCIRTVGVILCNKFYKTRDKEFVISETLLGLIRSGIRSKNTESQYECIGLLGHLARECSHTYYVLEDLNRLTDKADLEVDFFENLAHLQLHRKTRAMLKFCKVLETTKRMHCRTLTQFVLPLASQYLCNPSFLNKNSVIDAAIETLCTISRVLPWRQYELLIKFYLAKLRYKSEFQKQLVRLLVGILDAFHYDLAKAADADIQPMKIKKSDVQVVKIQEEEILQDDDDEPGEDVVVEVSDKVVLSQSAATKVIETIQNILMPQLYKTLGEMTHHENSHKVNRKQLGSEREEEELIKVPISLALVKLLQRLPRKMLDLHLSGIFLKLCSFLKSPLESVRRTARETLEKIMSSLGPEYLNCLLGEMITLLSKGFQVHVLSYTVYVVLNSIKDMYKPGDIDGCLLTVLDICTKDLFGITSEEKEVAKIVSKISEAKSKKSYDMFQLMAQYVTEKCLTDILMPLRNIMSKSPSYKTINKVEECLRFVVLGLVDNQFIAVEDLMIFAYGLASDMILKKEQNTKPKLSVKSELESDCFIIPKAPIRSKVVKSNAKINSHILMEFGIKLCYFMLKREKVKDGSYLDPFITVFVECLRSNHTKLCTLTLQCLGWCFKFSLPSLQQQVPEITKLMFTILHKYSSSSGENTEIAVAAFKTMAVLVRDAKYHNLNKDELKVLVLYIEQDLHTYEKQATAFALLKAILSRKFIIKELHELIKKVGELSVKSELPHIRLQSRQIYQQFIMDYPLGGRLENYVNFYISQLKYELQSGRESVLDMLLNLIKSFPMKVLKQFAPILMISIGARLVNDESPECRKMVANCITTLFERLSNPDRDMLFEIIILWFEDKNIMHKRLAAQLFGILVTVEKQNFENRLPKLLSHLLQQFALHNEDAPGQFVRLHSEDDENPEKILSKDHQLFQTLQMLLKIVQHCPNFFKIADAQLENLSVSVQSLLGYPHDWVRLASAQFIGLVLSNIDVDKLAKALKENTTEETGYLFSDPRGGIKSLTLDMCAQLQPNGVREDLIEQVVKNLVFVARVLEKIDNAVVPEQSTTKIDLLWLIKRMRRVINFEIVENPMSTVLRNEIFKWIAAVSTILEQQKLSKYLHHLVGPLVREMISTEKENTPLRHLAKQVGEILKRKVGMALYTQTLTDVERNINVQRAVRKRSRTQLAVTDPELYAKKKMKQHEKKKIIKKRKIQEGKGMIEGKRRFKKKRIDDE